MDRSALGQAAYEAWVANSPHKPLYPAWEHTANQKRWIEVAMALVERLVGT